MTAPVFMWEILVPTERRLEPGKFYTTRFHQVWDAKIREITGGLTIQQPVKGQWVAPSGELFNERMIPVRIMATEAQISGIIDMTMDYYDQLAILCYRVSDAVILRHRKLPHPCKKGCQYAKDVSMPENSCVGGCMYDKERA
jgi:hypothetical protein